MASEKKFGLGGNIISGLSKPGLGGAFGSFSRYSLTQSGMNTIQSDLTAFGNCPFNASNLSLSVYGNNSILGGAANNPYNRGAYAMMNGLHNMSPNRPPLLENYPSPYGRPSMDTQQTRRQTSKFWDGEFQREIRLFTFKFENSIVIKLLTLKIVIIKS